MDTPITTAFFPYFHSYSRKPWLKRLNAVWWVLLLSLPSIAQRPRRPATGFSGFRVEATGFLKWDRGDFDPTRGAEKYWIRVSVAKGKGKTSGGVTIDLPDRLTASPVNLIPPLLLAADSPRNGSGEAAQKATVSATCSYKGKRYRMVIDLTANRWRPSSSGNGRGRSDPGEIRVRVSRVDAGGKSSSSDEVGEAHSVERVDVRFFDRRSTNEGKSLSGHGR